jgi:hypothetical protein
MSNISELAVAQTSGTQRQNTYPEQVIVDEIPVIVKTKVV